MKKAEGVRAQFKTVAVIDWLEVTLTLIDNTQFRYVRDQLGVILGTAHPPYVKPISPGRVVSQQSLSGAFKTLTQRRWKILAE